MRFGAGATRKSPLVPVLGGAIGVAATPSRRLARVECRGHPRCAAQIDAGHGHGREAGDQRRRQVGGARSAGHARPWRSSGVTMGCPIRRSYAARRESGTCSTHAAAGKPAGLSHLNAFLANWSLVTPVPLASSMNRRRLSVSDAACAMRPRICAAATSARCSESRRASRSASSAGDDEPRNGQRKKQRYWCDLSRPHGPKTSLRQPGWSVTARRGTRCSGSS